MLAHGDEADVAAWAERFVGNLLNLLKVATVIRLKRQRQASAMLLWQTVTTLAR